MKKVLVTGGCGFVGRHVVLRQLQMGNEVWVVDDLSTGQHPDKWVNEKNRKLKQFKFIHQDVRKFFRDYLENRKYNYPLFDEVFHYAAVVGGRVKIDGDPIAVATDLAIDADFLAWAVKVKPGKILYASSSAAYPIDLQKQEKALALKEEFIQFGHSLGQPDMTYGWSKLTGEYLALIAAKNYGLHVACVRPFSGYGEDQDETYPIPAIAKRAAQKENPFIIWGSGEQGRDFVHIEDCVDAMFLILEKVSDGSGINIGTGKLMSFKDVAKKFIEFAGYDPEIKPLVDKPIGVHSRFADVEKITKEIGWAPKISVDEGFTRVYEAACNAINK